MTPVSLASLPGRRLVAQFTRYGMAGSAAVGVHLAVLAVLVEFAGSPAVVASVVGFGCGTLANYALQHRFVFSRFGSHGLYFPRYLAVTLGSLILNTLLFWMLSSGLGVYYLASQVLTIGVIVPLNFAINLRFTFATCLNAPNCPVDKAGRCLQCPPPKPSPSRQKTMDATLPLGLGRSPRSPPGSIAQQAERTGAPDPGEPLYLTVPNRQIRTATGSLRRCR